MSSITGHQPPALDDRQFELAVRKLADALQYGADSSPFLGAGLEYAQSRQYQTGDPVKSIDWRMTARSGKVFVKQYEAPKQMPTWLALDDSASMGVASAAGPSKWQWTLLLAPAIGLAALRRMSPVGVMTAHGERHSPSLSRARLFGWAHKLRRHAARGAASLGEVIRNRSATLLDRVNLVVLSDMHDPALIPSLRLVAEPHELIVLRLQDPAELGTTGGGVYRAVEPETASGFFATGRSRFGQDSAEEEMRLSGIDHLTLRTEQRWIPALREFLRRRGAVGGRQR